MMFAQSLGGLSHNKAEDTTREHLEMAVRAFGLLAEKTIARLVRDERETCPPSPLKYRKYSKQVG